MARNDEEMMEGLDTERAGMGPGRGMGFGRKMVKKMMRERLGQEEGPEEDMSMSESEDMSAENRWYSFEEIPELESAKVGDVITIQVKVVDKAEDGAQIEVVKSASKTESPATSEEPTPEEASKMSAADLEKILPKAEE